MLRTSPFFYVSLGMAAGLLTVIGTILVIDYYYARRDIVAPVVVGYAAADALKAAADQGLALKCVGTRVDNAVPVGSIVAQQPRPGMSMRPSQPLYVTLSVVAEGARAPLCLGLMDTEIRKIADDMKIPLQINYVGNEQPEGRCVAQNKAAGMPLGDHKLVVWCSHGISQARLMPSCQGMTVGQLKKTLEPLSAVIVADSPLYSLHDDARVVAHYPHEGTLIDRSHQVIVRVRTDRVVAS